MAWTEARSAAHAAGLAARPGPVSVPLAEADGLTLAAALTARTDLPAFPAATVDGYAVRGPGPWSVAGRVLAGAVPEPLRAGTAVQVATGAMVPAGTEQIIRAEEARRRPDGRVDGRGRPEREWREPGAEATCGDELAPAGTPVTPALIGLAAVCGHDSLPVIPAVRAAVLVFGDELLTAGLPGRGRVRDGLGPQLPGWLRRLGALPAAGFAPLGPVPDSLTAQASALEAALAHADLVCTAGGTMRGPVDHLRPALAALGGRYVVDRVAVRPGFPMVLAEVPAPDGRPRFVAGLPGNPQSAIAALVSLVAPLLRGLAGRPEPPLPTARLAERVPGRGTFARLVPVRVERGVAEPVGHTGAAMLRGLAGSDGFAVIPPGTDGEAGAGVRWAPLPLLPGQRP
ncbi:molybdopterin molybdotransferase MoeA [Plantactinospora siamensis]|uniref:Molybdopterin molybdenumtransferase n=1 Tax=Plantactinospora siamensis TaxID=555372 RepID=A0ABV6P4H3_9ACTN